MEIPDQEKQITFVSDISPINPGNLTVIVDNSVSSDYISPVVNDELSSREGNESLENQHSIQSAESLYSLSSSESIKQKEDEEQQESDPVDSVDQKKLEQIKRRQEYLDFIKQKALQLNLKLTKKKYKKQVAAQLEFVSTIIMLILEAQRSMVINMEPLSGDEILQLAISIARPTIENLKANNLIKEDVYNSLNKVVDIASDLEVIISPCIDICISFYNTMKKQKSCTCRCS